MLYKSETVTHTSYSTTKYGKGRRRRPVTIILLFVLAVNRNIFTVRRRAKISFHAWHTMLSCALCMVMRSLLFRSMSKGAVLALTVLAPANADLVGHGGMVRAVDFAEDGQRVVTASFDYSAIIWDFVDQQKINVLEGHEGPVTNARFLPDGRVFTTGDDMVGIIWRMDGEESRIDHRLLGHTHKIMAASVFDGGRLLVTGSWDKTVRIWNSRTGKQVRTIKLPVPVNAVAIIDGEKSIAVGGHDNVIRIYDLRTGRSQGKLEGHKMGITELRADPGGGRLLSSSIDKTLRLWDGRTLRHLRVFERHNSQVFGVRFTPDGKYAVSGGRDGYVMIWDLDTGKLVKSIKAHEQIIWSVAVSPDGRFAVSGSSDETARIWHLATGDRIGGHADANGEAKPWLTSQHPGASMFRKCVRCHGLIPNGVQRSGPHFKGLFGRRVGSVDGYRYSKALTGRDFIWNKETLFRLFDEGPDKFLPGTKMPVQRVTDHEKLTQLVDYLEQLTGAKR